MSAKTWRGAVAAAALLALSAGAAEAADELTLQLKWVTQAQFAGYFVAKDKGFYDEVGLDVTIKPGGPDINPSQVIAGGGADVVVDWMPSALATREKGVPLVNIAQVFQKPGLMLACRNDSGVTSPDKFAGHTLGVWFGGNEYPLFNWLNKLGLKTDGSPEGVTILKQAFSAEPLLQKQADCISVMIYNEYWQAIDGGMKPEDLTVFRYDEQGVATLEDGLYTLESNLKDPAMVDKLARFVKASMKGWDYAVANPDEGAMITLENDETGAQTEKHQKRMMGEIAKLVGTNPKGTGYLDEAAYEQTVNVLMSGGSDPVITAKPEGAWTHDIIEKALAM
jgi:NitT/TauT family transport system substrate-binding protein